ncbi:hypothetical protein [Natronolimnohabitans innermongolicus]|uniref:Uncharacterized protein n=1 Tax=Natronolimnohabitans innermongolicus JCM 12255 TaxID=1227499 RepID=L9WY93_9EURY|nr:hypothetical protein [Natronolimnohabitans innermongolicus]ELY53333.1 hypothetical protein C493_14933 [Natronolimnohabitans innermongolicus JCM 12255]
MAAHGFQGGTGVGVRLPDAVPFELPHPSRLSWELGSRIIDGDEATLHSEWARTGRSWELSVFRVTTNTVVVRIRTPVGRERFYGTAEQDLEPALDRLESATAWRRLE